MNSLINTQGRISESVRIVSQQGWWITQKGPSNGTCTDTKTPVYVENKNETCNNKGLKVFTWSSYQGLAIGSPGLSTEANTGIVGKHPLSVLERFATKESTSAFEGQHASVGVQNPFTVERNVIEERTKRIGAESMSMPCRKLRTYFYFFMS